MRYILVNLEDNKIINAIEIDPVRQKTDEAWPIPEGYVIYPSDIHQIGQVYEMVVNEP